MRGVVVVAGVGIYLLEDRPKSLHTILTSGLALPSSFSHCHPSRHSYFALLAFNPFIYQLVTRSSSSTCSWVTFSTFSAKCHCHLQPSFNFYDEASVRDLSPSMPSNPALCAHCASLLQSLSGTHYPSSQIQDSVSSFMNIAALSK